MKKRLFTPPPPPLIWAVLFCFAAAYGIQRWSVSSSSFEEFQNQWERFSTEKTAFSCNPPVNLGVKNLKSDEATIYWEDNSGSTWEYYVVPYGDPVPSTFATTTNQEEIITHDQNGNTLQPDTQYEFYVRTDCGAEGTSSWAGPFDFKTLCLPFAVSFSEGFNTVSTTFDCWTIIDNNKDAVSPTGNNIWKQHTATPYEGDRAMYFKGDSGKSHDDWLISPAITLTGGIYAISYYYKTSTLASDENEFEVLLSQNGIDIDQFTTVLLPKQAYAQSAYKKKTVYVQGITADVHLAWHITAIQQTEVYLDMVTVEEVACVGIDLDDIAITDLQTDEVTFGWTDHNNSRWEYYVQPINGGVPTGSGTPTNNKAETITRINGGGNLQPDTEYEFWIRTDCGSGNNSQWIGPIIFRTPCAILPLPFWEGFNSNSTTFDCWRIISEKGLYSWTEDIMNVFEGDITMLYRPDEENDAWLISPTFVLDAAKTYRLKYNYNDISNLLAVYISNKGTDLSDFELLDITHPVINKKRDNTSQLIDIPAFQQEKTIFTNIGGSVQLAWRVTEREETGGGGNVSIDSVFLEEVEGCAEPVQLNSKEEKTKSAVIYWKDDFNAEWEYVVQKEGIAVPTSTSSGIKTTTKENIITREFNGDLLEPDTVYEYYVRARCIQGQGDVELWSAWEGPFVFQTHCEVFQIPFFEDFDKNLSPTAQCWIILKEVNFGGNIWNFDGNNAKIVGSNNEKQDEWLISPTLQMDSNKKYKLTFTYWTDKTVANFEVLVSDKGKNPKDFSQIWSKSGYANENKAKAEIIVSDLGGQVNFAWRFTAEGGRPSSLALFIDDVYIEELDCSHPENLTAEDIKEDEVTISWNENKSMEWEYIIQKKENLTVRPSGSGIPTSTHENVISKDSNGKDLKPNTDYEFYVRTNCGNGDYSEWAGPYDFTTGAACKDGFDAPFWEGFNSDSQTVDCWSIVETPNGAVENWQLNYRGNSARPPYEGDGMVHMTSMDMTGQIFDSWLISPTIKLDGGSYILKYYYTSVPDLNNVVFFNNQVEVLLSTRGKSLDQFTTTLLPQKDYNNGGDWIWKEEKVYIDGIKGDINLAWHIVDSGSKMLGIDNVSIEKVKDCPEPYAVEIVNINSTTIDISWKQDGSIAEWELIVVEYGEDETAIPVQTANVTGTPEASLSGLDSNKEYTIYVRTICAEQNDKSEWSSPIHKIPEQTNVDCGHAKTIPVNPGPNWDRYVYGSFVGATLSTVPTSTCNRDSAGYTAGPTKDIWFEFTATEKVHLLNIMNFPILLIPNPPNIGMYVTVYEGMCSGINSNSEVVCFMLDGSVNTHYKDLRQLMPGQKYYIRFEVPVDILQFPEYTFDVSITSPSIEFSSSGDLYTDEELVKDVWLQSNCDLVSNIKHTAIQKIDSLNTLGYFKNTKGKEVFPFKEGIVLSTGVIDHNVFGPFNNNADPQRVTKISTDNDLAALMSGIFSIDLLERQASLEFDFIPVKDSIQFEYLFASDCYAGIHAHGCHQNWGGGIAGIWIIDESTGERSSVAVTPETKQPISTATIWDGDYYPLNVMSTPCYYSMNPDLFWKRNSEERDTMKKASVNFEGSTVPLKTQKTAVIPGHKYKIKIIVADDCGNTGIDFNAIFLNSESFNTGDIDLGPDWLIATNNALCYNQAAIISSQTDISDLIEKEYEWYKDGVLIPGANTPDLAISEAGEYKVVMKLTELNCAFTDTITVEVYPAISETVHQAEAIVVCQYSLQETIVDLTAVETTMFAAVDRSMYTTGYYQTAEEAEVAENAIANAERYSLGKEPPAQNLYIRVENTITGCHEVFVLPIQPEEGSVPDKPSDVTVCSVYEFPPASGSQYYYTESGGQGSVYQTGDVLAEPGEHTIYLLQVNTDKGCYEEIAYQVNITAPVTAAVFEDQTLSCEYYGLAPLSEHNRYYTEPEGPKGEGTQLYEGMQILHKQTVYVYASSDDGLCTDESSFTIDYEDCPIPRGISPNNDGLNDVFDLTPHGVESIKIYNRWGTEVYSHGEGYTTQWHGQSKSGKQLPDGTYYYVIQAHGKIRTGWVQINK